MTTTPVIIATGVMMITGVTITTGVASTTEVKITTRVKKISSVQDLQKFYSVRLVSVEDRKARWQLSSRKADQDTGSNELA
jgi:flagellar biosynthesis protein FlhB